MNAVAEIELYRLKVPLRTPYKLAFGLVRHFDTLVAKVVDSLGETGLGEATVLTGYTEETADDSWALMRQLAEKAVGVEPEEARERLLGYVDDAPFTVTALVTAIEMSQGSAFLSVPATSPVPLLGLVNTDAEAALADEIDGLLEKGFRTLKVKVGFDADSDVKRLALIQRTVGGRAAIRVDANQGFSVADAKRFAAGIEPEGIELFEQPCHADDWDAAVAVAAVSRVPMMLDESIYGLEDIKRAAELNAARFIKLKLMKLGSLERLGSAINLIRDLGMEPVLGNGVACEIGCWMEASIARTHIRNAGEMNGYLKQSIPLLTNPPPFDGGSILLSSDYRPELDESALQRVACDRAHFRASVLVNQ